MSMGKNGYHVCSRLGGFALSFLDRTNEIVTSLTAAFVLYTRSAGVAYFAAGAVSCSLTVKPIKRGIQQPRPPVLMGRKVKVSYGMPSTHSATITFFGTYILLACRNLPIHKTLSQSTLLTRLVPPVVAIPWAVAILVSRVLLGYHTWAQVAVGSAYGGWLATMWFVLWTRGGLNEIGLEVERAVWTWFGWW